MDTESLVENLIDDGKRLVEYLPQRGFPIAAAIWLKASHNSRWYFYLVSSLVATEGIQSAYGRLLPLRRQVPGPLGIDPLKVTLIGLEHPIAKDVLTLHARAPGPQGTPVRWGGRSLGNLGIEEAYVYPVPAAAA
jgi:hypothetical protein